MNKTRALHVEETTTMHISLATPVQNSQSFSSASGLLGVLPPLTNSYPPRHCETGGGRTGTEGLDVTMSQVARRNDLGQLDARFDETLNVVLVSHM